MIRSFIKLVFDLTGCHAHIFRSSKIFGVRYGLRTGQRIVRFLYEDSSVSLDRKRCKVEELLKVILGNDWSFLTRPVLDSLLGEMGQWTRVATHLGINLHVLTRQRRRLGMSIRAGRWNKGQ